MPTTFRGPSAKTVLNVDWEYPVWEPPEVEGTGDTVARQARKALTREDALKYIAGDDPRPLLVLRECKVCNGTDAALLKFNSENEKTFLMSAWFRCVKLPVDVMEEDHPFHNLFQVDPTEHLFVSSVDGATHLPLESETSRTELWDSMRKVLAEAYTKKPDASLKKLSRLLDKLDAADLRWNELTSKKDDILEEDGPRSKKLPKVDRDIAKVETERQELLGEVAEAFALKLKKSKEADQTEDAEPATAGTTSS